MQSIFRVRGARLCAVFTILATVGLVHEACASSEDQIPAFILKVEGDGISNVRKRSGVVESAGARGKVYVGDRVITDARSAVHLMLNDGSVLKVGFSSEFTLEKVKNERKYLSWFFKLVHGSIRALVEKIPTQETHFRIETQSGTIGVRGTEFVLVYDETSSASSLYMVDGVVSYGVASCEKSHSCLDVRGGETASMVKGALKPTNPAAYGVKELFGVGKHAAAPGASEEARMSLFRDARRVQARVGTAVDDSALKKIMEEAVAEMAAAQDRAIGRTKEQREAMHEAIKNGTYDSVIAAADSYAAAQGIFSAAANGGAENLVAQVAASKFRLGDAVKKADAAGLFLDFPTPAAGAVAASTSTTPFSSATSVSNAAAAYEAARSFQLRKDVDYSISAVAKIDKEMLSKAADDYRDTLSYAEALSAAQVSTETKSSTVKASTTKAEEADETSTAGAESKMAATKAAAACNKACEDARVAHEVDVASEGSVTAYQEPSKAAASSSTSEAVPSKRGKGGLPGSVKTRFFRRTVPGNSCFRTQQRCTMQPCSGFGKGKKCKANENVQVCDSKQVPVRCEDQ